MTLPLGILGCMPDYYFFLNLAPAKPTKPVPKRSMVAGSETGAGDPFTSIVQLEKFIYNKLPHKDM